MARHQGARAEPGRRRHAASARTLASDGADSVSDKNGLAAGGPQHTSAAARPAVYMKPALCAAPSQAASQDSIDCGGSGPRSTMPSRSAGGLKIDITAWQRSERRGAQLVLPQRN